MIHCDDCLNILKSLGSETVDVVYLDPPFFTQKKHCMQNSEGEKYEFSDLWDSRLEYLTFLRTRLMEMHRVLKSTGSVFLHCDGTSSHYLRILLDEIFGENNYRSEIIWTYKRWSNSKNGLLPAHQTIFFYSKTLNYKFHTLYTDYSPTTNIDQILQDRVRNDFGKAIYKTDENGTAVLAKEKKGVPMSDVWEIPFLNPKAKERTGYPTQKPIILLERILKISTDENDVVLDPFCGSGTTLIAAKLLNRRYIGIDSNPAAVAMTKSRLKEPIKTRSTLLEVGAEKYKMKSDKEMAILNQFDCTIVQRNKGIDAFLKKYYLDAPVAIKVQRESETLIEAVQLLHEAGKKKRCSFTILVKCNVLEFGDMDIYIPQNMVVVDSCKLQVEMGLKYCLDTKNKSAQ